MQQEPFFTTPYGALINCLFKWNIIQQKPPCNTLSIWFDFWSLVAFSCFSYKGGVPDLLQTTEQSKASNFAFIIIWKKAECATQKFRVKYIFFSYCNSFIKLLMLFRELRWINNAQNVHRFNSEQFVKNYKDVNDDHFTKWENWWSFLGAIVLVISPVSQFLSFCTLRTNCK